MKNKIVLITILTDNVSVLSHFYQDVMGFQVSEEMGEYVEFASEGVRFAICSRTVLENATGDASYQEPRRGQCFELAFEVQDSDALDELFAELVAKGAKPVQEPGNMPWGQRTAFFADPDGNIHELFTELEQGENQT
jgi:lactoylglutathione lyase